MQSLPVRFSSCSEKQLEETSAEQMASSPSSVMPQSREEARRTATADPQSLEVRVVADEAAERGDAGERERVPGDAQRDERVVQRGRVDGDAQRSDSGVSDVVVWDERSKPYEQSRSSVWRSGKRLCVSSSQRRGMPSSPRFRSPWNRETIAYCASPGPSAKTPA